MPKSNYTPQQVKQLALQKQQQFLTTAKEHEALFINLLTSPDAAEAGASEASMGAVLESHKDAKLHYANTITLTDANGLVTEYLAVLRHSRADGNKGKGKLRLDIFENHIDHIAGNGTQSIVWNLFATAYQDDNDKLQFKFTSVKQNAATEISWVIKLFRDKSLQPANLANLTPEEINEINNRLQAEAMAELAKLKALGITSKHELIQIKDENGLICYGIVTQNLGEIDLFTLLMNHVYKIERAPQYQVTTELAWKLILGSINAVKKINDAGWVHRDIKLENIMASITAEGEAEINIADYGYAGDLTHYDFQRCGSVSYAAPELYLNNNDLSADYFSKVDVYSLGWVIAFLSASRNGLNKLYARLDAGAVSFEAIEFEMRQDFPWMVRVQLRALIYAMLEVDVEYRLDMTEVYEQAQGIQTTWDNSKGISHLLAKPHTQDIANVVMANSSEAISHATMQVRQITNFFQTVLPIEQDYNDALDEEINAASVRLQTQSFII
jgi:serine/threonine protein kinase